MQDIRTPYPLTWPAGWPRARSTADAPFHKRIDTGRGYSSKTDLTMVDAREQLQRQLELLGAREILLSTNVELTLNGSPRSGKARPTDVGVACYFKLNGRDTVLACDKWRRVEDNIAAIAKHIDAIRGQTRWGVGSVEQAFTGYQALPAPTTRPWWDVFGIGPDASVEIINTRYRALSKAAAGYPGGAEKRQLELNTARDAALLERKST